MAFRHLCFRPGYGNGKELGMGDVEDAIPAFA